MLSSSSEYKGDDLAETLQNGDGGVKLGHELSAFARAALGDDPEELRRSRAALRSVAGDDGLVDAAAVVANFSMVDRVADAIGIPLDFEVDVASAGLRHELQLSQLGGAANTPHSLARRIFRTVLRPFSGFMRFTFRNFSRLLPKT